MSRTPALLLAAILTLSVLAGVAVALSDRPTADEGRAAEFYRLVGGLGFGPALDLSSCEYSLDPRICPACSQDVGPIPGGLPFCPHHACSVFAYPTDQLFPSPEPGPPADAPLP